MRIRSIFRPYDSWSISIMLHYVNIRLTKLFKISPLWSIFSIEFYFCYWFKSKSFIISYKSFSVVIHFIPSVFYRRKHQFFSCSLSVRYEIDNISIRLYANYCLLIL
nr:MAG TPA: hypothetical protein [Caudoviricetes sp.]